MINEIIEKFKQAEKSKTFPLSEWHRKDLFESLIKDFLIGLGYNPDQFDYDDLRGVVEIHLKNGLKVKIYLSSLQENQRFLSNKLSAPIDTIPNPETGKQEYEITVVTNFYTWFFYFDGKEIYATTIDRLANEYELVRSLLSREAIESGRFKEVARKLLYKDDNEPLRRELNVLREKIANKILQEKTNLQYIKNPDGTFNNEILNEITTRWITRFLALKLAEDSGISFNFTLRDIRQSFRLDNKIAKPVPGAKVKEETLSNAIRALMSEFERRYNGGIFMYEEGVDYITVPDSAFFDLLDFATSWAFTIEDARIIGFVYERFLGQEIVVEERKGTPEAVLKDIGEARGRRKAAGIYYTPKYIVDYIVENTLGEILKEKRNEIDKAVKNLEIDKFIEILKEVKSLHVLDPACGSGSFLIKVLAEFKNFYDDAKNKAEELEKKIDALKREKTKGQMLFTDDKEINELLKKYSELEKEIEELKFSGVFALRNNIYGVDIDPKAIDIAAFTLMVQVYDELKDGARCPTMINENLKIGNSLVSAISPDKRNGFKSRGELEGFEDDISNLIALREIEKRIDLLDEVELKKLIEKNFEDIVDVYISIKEKYPNAIPTPQQKLLDEWHKKAKKEPIEKTFDVLIHQTGLARIFLKEVYFERIKRIKEKIEFEINKPLIKYFNSEKKLLKDREFEEILKDEERIKEELKFIKDRATEISKSQPPKVFNWELEFPEVFFNEDGTLKENPGFDCVVGNPPFMIMQDEIVSAYMVSFFDTCKDYPHTAIAFLEKVISVGAFHEEYGMVSPKSISYVDKWSKIRLFLSENGFKSLVDISDAFVGVNLEQVCVLGKKGEKKNFYTSVVFRNNKFETINTYSKELLDTWNYWHIWSTDRDIEILKKILTYATLFRNFFINSFEGLGGIKKHFLPIDKGDVPILTGKDIDRFYIKPPAYSIKKSIIFSIEGKPKTEKIKMLLQPKIVAQNVLTKINEPGERVLIKASIDKEGIFTFNTVQAIFLSNFENAFYIVALLNSTFISWFATYFIYNKAKLTMHFDREYVGKIPIVRATPDQQAPIISLVDAIIQKKKEYHSISQNIEDYIDSSKANLINLDEFLKMATREFEVLSSIKVKTDNFDALRVRIEANFAILEYGIKRKIEEYEEIDEEEDVEVKGKYVIDWSSAGKGEIKDIEAIEFLSKTLENIKNFSKAKQKSIWQKIAEVKVPEFNELVREGFLKFKSAMQKAKELDEEIIKIDRAIDRLVYDLYGLTEEEIKVVEKSVWEDRFEEMYSKLPSKESALKLAEVLKK